MVSIRCMINENSIGTANVLEFVVHSPAAESTNTTPVRTVGYQVQSPIVQIGE